VLRGPASTVLAQLSTTKGEFSIVIAPKPSAHSLKAPHDEQEIWHYFCCLTNEGGSTRRSAIAATAKQFGLPARTIYALVETFKAGRLP
jgi:hypothetical protein